MKSSTNPKMPYRMERVKVLINKLQHQLQHDADPGALLLTAQLLQAELQSLTNHSQKSKGTAKVAVVLPNTASIPKSSMDEQFNFKEDSPKAITNTSSENNGDWLQNLMQEIPTLAHQKEFKELNEWMGQQNSTSINDSLKQESRELAEILVKEPISDLKKGIGINDRFVFVQDLFRGDEVMYERSIKTINAFNVLQEAEFWIQRELILKLGWDEGRDCVRHFRHLVRRRFASM
jgi:hypothetical protein